MIELDELEKVYKNISVVNKLIETAAFIYENKIDSGNFSHLVYDSPPPDLRIVINQCKIACLNADFMFSEYLEFRKGEEQ